MKTVIIFFAAAAASIVLAACGFDMEIAEPENDESRVDVMMNGEGFVPSALHAIAGQELRLTVTRTIERTCSTEFVIKNYASAGSRSKIRRHCQTMAGAPRGIRAPSL